MAKKVKIVQEGQAAIVYNTENPVFYNNVQVLNRDLSIAVISHFSKLRDEERMADFDRKKKNYLKDVENGGKLKLGMPSEAKLGISIFEALSATGLRSIRYYQEIPNVNSILINDIEPAAVDAIETNLKHNGITSEKMKPNLGDATMVMYEHRTGSKQFDVVDLDPYGSAAPFLDSAVQAVANGGLLCVTCTDMPVLSGNNPEVCFARYGSMPYKSNYLHENALRMVLSSMETTANKYGRHIVPVISCSIDFYVRVFVRVYKSPKNVKEASMKSSMIYQCIACDSFHLQPRGRINNHKFGAATGPVVPQKCDQCGSSFRIAGPIWSAPIHNVDTVKEILKHVSNAPDKVIPTKERLHGLLTTVSEEVVDAPLYYSLPGLCKTLHAHSPPMKQFKAAIINAGYEVSQCHKKPDAIKTNAPNHIVWDIMRCWVKKHPLDKKRVVENSIGQIILSKEPKHIADFTVPQSLLYKTKAVRFAQNPEPLWGPKKRATGKMTVASDDESESKKAKTN